MINFAIVKTHPDALKYVVSLQAKHSNELGFLPQCAFEEKIGRGQLFLGLLNGEPCGYILAGSGFQGILRRWQCCIQYDARRRLYGAMLVAAVEKYGEDLGCWQSLVRCASDLEANEFWKSVGYTLVGFEPGGKSRGRIINLWSKQLYPAARATHWLNGRPRIYESANARLRAWRERKRNSAAETKAAALQRNPAETKPYR